MANIMATLFIQKGNPMAEHQRFHLDTMEKLKAELSRLQQEIPVSDDLTILADRVAIGRYETPNRFAVHPMEGFDADEAGAPQELSFRRYQRYAAGGSGLIWFEATAVVHEGRSNPGQFCLHAATADTFKRLVEGTRKAARDAWGHDPVLVLQLTHSGRYSKPSGMPEPIIAHHSPILDPKHNLPPDYPLVTDDYLDRLQDRFVEAAKLAAAAGFDGVDVKSCHRYLLSELFASFTREGRYGGSFENRTRMLRETLARIAAEAPKVFITTRMNAYDAISHPYGWGVDENDFRKPDLSEPVRLVAELRKIGVPVLNLSIGNPYYQPHYGRPFDFPIAGFMPPDEHPLEGISRFISITRKIQESQPGLPVIASGYTWFRQWMPHVAAAVIQSRGATLIGQGRGAFAYPDSVRDILQNGRMDPAKCCVTCSACTQIMRDGGQTGCVVRDAEIYGPQYRLGRRFAMDHLQEEAGRCRECEVPTCQDGCPAHVDIPKFLRAFADGDIAAAYAVLRARNVLPEMCGHVCPSEVQCEGGCVEAVFTENPLPIRDIQLVTCRVARLQNLVGLRLPETTSLEKIAVVGAGPAGLACAIRLLELGHEVSIFDRNNSLGGTPDTVIPGTRYGNAGAEVDAILAPALKAGRVQLNLGKVLGRDFELAALQQEFSAVFLAIGLTGSTSLGKADGVMDALHFLREAKQGRLRDLPDKVAVLGGGNTAMDAAATAKRLGARDVYIVYRRSFSEMPAWPAERDECLRMGVHFLILQQPLEYLKDDDNRLRSLLIARTKLGEPDASGRRRPEVIARSRSELEVGLAIEAIGQGTSAQVKAILASGMELTDKGLVRTAPASAATSMDRVFAGGDIVNGGTTAVQGVAEGMRAAGEIDLMLKK